MSRVRVFPPAVRASFGYRLPSTPDEASGRLAKEGLQVLAEPAGFLVMPLTVGGGALVGWLRGVPEESTRTAEATIAHAWSAMDPGAGFAREMRAAGGRLKAAEWSLMESGEIPRRNGSAGSRGGEYWLIIHSMEVALDVGDTESTVNPRLRLVMKADCSIKRASDGKELVQLRREHRGPRHTFTAWSRNEARRLAEAVERGQRKLAEDMTTELLSW